jgi:hypothetical protein
MSMSPSLEPALPELRWPVETDIYILPDGQIVVADLPAELAVRLPWLGALEPCELIDHEHLDSFAGFPQPETAADPAAFPKS